MLLALGRRQKVLEDGLLAPTGVLLENLQRLAQSDVVGDVTRGNMEDPICHAQSLTPGSEAVRDRKLVGC